AAVAAALIGSLPGRGALGSSRVAPGAGEPGGPDGPGAPPTAPVGAPPARGFSGAFWCFWVGLIAAVAIENATTFWAADLLISRTGAGPGIATGALAGLIGGMSAARFIVGPLSLRGQAEKLLIIAFVLAGAGWLVLWLATTTTLAVVGLVVAGLGYGAQYPLSIALVLRASAGRPDQAQARATLGAGGAIAVAPFLLGALADRVGSHSAFLLVPALISIGAVAVALGLRRVRSAAKS
ncbi:MFS transporter, partial [Pengzhenrongella sp.]|uniref:MFS transporter n=1 Tax=Pengzhenrongella sp. TaxID=2888820 RepID=UPI002F93735F